MHISITVLASLFLTLVAADAQVAKYKCTSERGYVQLFNETFGEAPEVGFVEPIKHFCADCKHSCHAMDFNAITVKGGAIFMQAWSATTRCQVYRDQDCLQPLLDTRDVMAPRRFNVPGARSYLCSFNC